MKKIEKKKNPGGFAIIIPVYNHEDRVCHVVAGALGLNIPVFVVDDGSTDSTHQKLEAIEGIRLLRHPENRGKGAAIATGFARAAEGADWAITLDADGQHDPADALKLMRAIPESYRGIIIGKRENMIGSDVPWTSRFGRKFSNFWVFLAGGPALSDSQSGFRIYPLPEAMNLGVKARRFQFEVEILAKAGWHGMEVLEAPIGVSYTPGMKRISHFRPFWDFVRNSLTFSRLIFQRIVLPLKIRKKL